ncbi:retrovirus-related pol polyprotein from transposon TNT 1-94 [Tanacetum coccineum]|uniref:Retrovirus-related pol polyprotein from transposon TNT 1-94 n=1 Tax=Tanacetum coccineum TaxID=301880 RepID=A0ABQ5G4H6_9ASTR
MTHPYSKRNYVPRAVLMKFGLKTLNTAKQNSSRAAISVNTTRPINTAYTRSTMNSARPTINIFNKAHSHVQRSFNKYSTDKNSNFNVKVNTVKENVTIIGSKAVVSDNMGNEANAVKALTCWVWRPNQKVLDHIELQDKGVIDSGCSRHMTRNKSYLSDYKEIDGGFVAFGGNSKGGKITGKEMNQFCEMKGIKREFSVARTQQQNRVAERKNRIILEAVRTMLADSMLPTTFWGEVVNTACYVQNRVLVIKPHNKTPYELFNGRPPTIIFMRPFGCPVTILNTLDHLGKFDRKADEGFFIRYSINSKAFRVFNSRTRIVEENLHITFLENKPNVAGSGPEWLFDIDRLTKSMNYKSVVVGNQANGNAGTKDSLDAGQARKKTVPGHEYILLPLCTSSSPISSSPKSSDDEVADDTQKKSTEAHTNNINTASSTVNTACIEDNDVDENVIIGCAHDPNIPELEDTGIFGAAYVDEDFVAGRDMNNLESTMSVSLIATTRIYKDHPAEQIIRDLHLAMWKTRRGVE